MKLTLKRTHIVSESIRVEDEIHLDDDAPVFIQYSTTNNEKINSYDLPPDSLTGYVRPVVSHTMVVNFPFIEFLCRQIFSDQSDK